MGHLEDSTDHGESLQALLDEVLETGASILDDWLCHRCVQTRSSSSRDGGWCATKSEVKLG
eukprot:3459992-Rhodomonas_salina.1